MKKRSKGDVQWYVSKRKTPIAYSTTAASALIVALSQEYDTIQEVRDAIAYDVEARNILDLYIERGYGACIARDMFR